MERRLNFIINVLTLLILVWIGWRLTRLPATSSSLVRVGVSPHDPPLPARPIAIADAELQGSPSARVALEEFTDGQCWYCGQFARNTLPQVEKEYVRTGKVLLAVRHFPLEQMHAQALSAAEAAECAGQQGRFWEMQNLIFDNQALLDAESLRDRAASLGLDAGRFSACLAGPVPDRIRRDQTEGRALGVTGTPTLFVGAIQRDGRLNVRRRTSGAMSFDQLKEVLEQLLQATRDGAAEQDAPER